MRSMTNNILVQGSPEQPEETADQIEALVKDFIAKKMNVVRLCNSQIKENTRDIMRMRKRLNAQCVELCLKLD